MATPSWNRVEVDLAALRHNFRELRRHLDPKVEILAVVKADAYGHGLLASARAFAEAGARVFGVAEVDEGVRLRREGIDGRIVVLLGTDRHGAEAVVESRLSPVVNNPDTAAALALEARKRGRRVDIQIKVDIGMGRLGLAPREFAGFITRLADWPELRLSGIMTHLPKADIEGDSLSAEQTRLFHELLQGLPESAGAVCHLANSAALLTDGANHCGMVRPGITLYGSYPAPWLRAGSPLALRPAMRLQSRVIQVKEVPAGQGISYGHRYVTDRPTRLAVLPIGYANGYLRRLTGRAEVLLHGRRVPIRGTVCMNACMADVTEIPAVETGDEVVLLGRQGNEEILAAELAEWSSTIDYEILCLFGACNRKSWLDSEADGPADPHR